MRRQLPAIVWTVLSTTVPLFGQDADYASLRPPRPEVPSVPGLAIKEP